MILFYREVIARKCIGLFFFFAPKKMQIIYAKYILIATQEYLETIKNETK